MSDPVFSKRDVQLAERAKGHGANYSLRIVLECRRTGLPISLGFALVEQESNFRNVFGHDPTSSIPRSWMGTTVTKAKYLVYKLNRRRGKGMQGVGPCQLTWYATQDVADKLGGCHVPAVNIRVAFATLAQLVQDFGLVDGCRRYNGSGPDAVRYSVELRRKAQRWHLILTNPDN